VPFLIRLAERAGLRAQEQHGLHGLGEEVVALILRHAHAGLMVMPELVVLLDLDIVSCVVGDLQPAADNKVEASPDVTRPEQAQLQATAAGERGRDSCQTVEPVMEEGPAYRAAFPRTPRVLRLDARTRRVGRQRDRQEAPDRELVDRELQDPGTG
jgi:hypothetical protein